MLEGKELEVKLGEYGSASVDVTPDLKVIAQVQIEVDLLEEIHKLAEQTETPIDDMAIAWIEKLISIAQPKS